MRRLLILLAMLLAASPALAQNSLSTTGAGGYHAGAASFVGAGDLGTWTAYWGTRAYSSATRGNKLLNACTPNTAGTCADMLSDATTGDLVPATIGGNPCPGVSCIVEKYYDLTGNGHDMGNSAGNAPFTLTASVANGHACGVQPTNPSVSGYITAGNINTAQPFSVASVVDTTGNLTSYAGMLSEWNNGIWIFGHTNSNNQVRIYAGAELDATASDSSFHAIMGLASGASSKLIVDGSTTTGNAGTTTANNVMALGNDAVGNGPWVGKWCEGGLATSTDLTAVGWVANVRAWYGF